MFMISPKRIPYKSTFYDGIFFRSLAIIFFTSFTVLCLVKPVKTDMFITKSYRNCKNFMVLKEGIQ